MTRTLLQVRTELRERLLEATARAWDDADLNSWINEGARDVARKTECLTASSLLAVTALDRDYSITVAVVRIHRIEWQPSNSSQIYPLEGREFNTMDGIWWTGQATRQGTPQYYATWGYPPDITIVLYPTPTVSGNLKLFYARMPTDASGDAVAVDVPEGWHDLVMDYAEYRAFRRARMDDRAAGAYQKYTEVMRDLVATLAGSGPHWNSAPGRIVPMMPVGGLPTWLTDGGWY